ncbi:hypothetical protein AB0L40_12730 [Patulibacter sp. NPDC049589]|uniref:hypothetical protein n=1 Tax=Patulibacter sp. NPDC049589 TaxID=3154731 RepID=UPI003436B3C0
MRNSLQYATGNGASIFTSTLRRRLAVLLAIVALVLAGSAVAAQPKVWSPKVTAYESAGSPADAEARAPVERTRLANVDIDAARARTVGDPSGETKTWTVVPIESGICAVFGDGNVLCGHDERLAVSGASVIWSTPSPVEVQEGTGAYAFRGIAVDDVASVAVINQDGVELAKTAPKGSVFAITVAAAKQPTALRLTGSDGQVSVIEVD